MLYRQENRGEPEAEWDYRRCFCDEEQRQIQGSNARNKTAGKEKQEGSKNYREERISFLHVQPGRKNQLLFKYYVFYYFQSGVYGTYVFYYFQPGA